jgi:hypothetical protein
MKTVDKREKNNIIILIFIKINKKYKINSGTSFLKLLFYNPDRVFCALAHNGGEIVSALPRQLPIRENLALT